MSKKVQMIYKKKPLDLEIYSNQAYLVRKFNKEDKDAWANIMVLSGEFKTLKEAKKRFKDEFEAPLVKLEEACLFLETKEKEIVGTIMAYEGILSDQKAGRIHWLSIIPKYQGLGLSKILLFEALSILNRKHDLIYLTTQVRSLKAIHLYLKFGFEPLILAKKDIINWQTIHKAFNAL